MAVGNSLLFFYKYIKGLTFFFFLKHQVFSRLKVFQFFKNLYKIFGIYSIGIYLINNVVIVSGGQRKNSAIHIHLSIPPKLPSHSGCHMTLSRVPRAVQQVLAGSPC